MEVDPLSQTARLCTSVQLNAKLANLNINKQKVQTVVASAPRGADVGVSLLERMRANPQANWTIKHVVTLCDQHGVGCHPPRGGGSHYKVQASGRRIALTVPAQRPIKPVYIKALVGLILTLKDELG